MPAQRRAATSPASKVLITSTGTPQRLARTRMASPATWKSGRQASQRSVGSGTSTSAQASELATRWP